MRFRRFFWRAGMGVVASGAVVMLPPKEMLPDRMLHVRVICEGFLRLFRCAYVAGCILFDYKWNLTDNDTQANWDAVHQRSAERLVVLAQENGGLYVKSGQGFATMNHLLPRQYWYTMRKLMDENCTRPYSEVVAVIEKDLEKPMSDLFAEFEEEPIAAASLAQVHRAKLVSGEKVAVKVQYIDIAQRFAGDMGTIVVMLSVAGVFFPGYDFGTIMEKSREILSAELRFTDEARNSERCRTDMQKAFGDAVTTPTVHWSHTTDRVMTTDFIDGCKMDDVKGMEKLRLSKKEVATLYCQTFAHQLFISGFLHCDPHPGNCLARKNPKNGKAQLVLLDHGLYTHFPDSVRKDLANVWTSMTRHDDAALEASCKAMDIDNYKLFASMLLQHPYDFFTPFKKTQTEEEFQTIRKASNETMPEVNEILGRIPNEISLALRNINIVRAVNKVLGNPVSRTAIMLRYSVQTSHQGAWTERMKCLVRLWFDETVAAILFSYARWKDPEMMAQVDEMLQMG